jgi:excisionase family DNA binding protein
MSALTEALVADLAGATEEQRAQLAELLRPYLTPIQAHATVARWLRGADQIAAYIGAPRSRVYALTSARRIPVERDGSALIAHTTALDDWLRAGGGKRP